MSLAPIRAGVFTGLIIGKSCTCCAAAEAAPLNMSVFQLPVINDLRNPTLKPRHWAAIEQTVDALLVDIEIPLTLERLSELHVFDFAQEIQDISGQASGEAALEIILKKVSQGKARHGDTTVSCPISCPTRETGPGRWVPRASGSAKLAYSQRSSPIRGHGLQMHLCTYVPTYTYSHT